MSEISGAINNVRRKTTKQCKKLAKNERLQKAFLCSTLMKSYAFVVMLLPSCDVKVIAPFVVGS